MHDLALTITPRITDVLVGASLDVTVEIVNTGTAPAVVVSHDSPDEFEYVLRPADGGANGYQLSASRTRAARSADTFPALARLTTTLAPGAREVYPGDLAEYFARPVEPGVYLLSVRYSDRGERLESPAVQVSIGPPRVLALASVTSPDENERFGFAFLHREGNGAGVYQVEGEPEHPTAGVRYRRAGAAAPSTVAVAVEFEDSESARWFAWLDGDALHAGVGQFETLFLERGPVPTGLHSNELHPVGWQYDTNTALFATLGVDGEGRVCAALVFVPSREAPSVLRVALATARMPSRWAMRHRGNAVGALFDVVYAEEAAGWSRLVQQTINTTDGSVTAPLSLVERPEPLVALRMPAVEDAPVGTVNALFGPRAESAGMTLLRRRLDDGGAMGEVGLLPPGGATGPSVGPRIWPTAWAISAPAQRDPVVLAHHGDAIMMNRVVLARGWSTVEARARGAQHLRVEVDFRGRSWAIWVDPDHGLVSRLVHTPERDAPEAEAGAETDAGSTDA